MSMVDKTSLLERLSQQHIFQTEGTVINTRTPPTVINYKESPDDIVMNDMEEFSISSEDESESAMCHIRHKLMTQQPWSKEEIRRSLANLPAGEIILSTLPNLCSDDLQKVLDELTNIPLNQNTAKDNKSTTSTFANGCKGKASLGIVNEAIATDTPIQLLSNWPHSCLLVSSWMGYLEIVKALLNKSLQVSCKDDNGRTPLHLAACTASIEVLEELLKHGSDPNEWDYDSKFTALHCSAAVGNLNCVQCLLAAGADVNAGLSERSPLHYAVLSNAADCVDALLRAGACPNNPQVYTETPLHVAASLGSVACTKLLLSHGADVRVQFGSARSTPLHLAAEEGSAECTKLLLSAGAPWEARNARGQTAMHLAALAQSAETLDVLIMTGARINVEDNDGRTPLHAAVAKALRGSELVRILMKAGASVNKADKFGYTPLHVAALNESSSTVMLLLSKGADVTARTKGGVSALSFIVRRTPDVLPYFVARLDQAISLHDHELGDVDCELRLDFRPLLPGGRGETDLLLCLVEVGQRYILKHPLCESFLYLKWLRIRKFFLLSLIFHSIFVTFFTGYIGVTYLWNMEKLSKLLVWPVLSFTCVHACKEMFQIAHGVLNYIKRWENWLQWGVIFLTAIVLIKPTSNWQYHFAALGILLIWIELMIVVGRFPMFGLYIQMFTQVSINFFKFLGAYMCLIIGFSLGFTVLHKSYKSFINPLVGLLKTIIMMSGEIEFEDVFFDEETPILYSGTAHLMLLSFVILVTIILTNLMVGLAVSDIQELRRCAGLDRLVRQAELVSHVESMLFSRLLDYAPKNIMRACRKGALLLHPPYHCALHIRPNDPREKRLPSELIKAVYRLVSEKKTRRTMLYTKNISKKGTKDIASTEAKLSRLCSTVSTSDHSQLLLNELANELKRCLYKVNTHVDSIITKMENISADEGTSVHL